MSLVRMLLGVAGRRAARPFQEAARDPAATQLALLRAMISRNAHTTFGREHGFDSIRSPGDFARQVPVRDYEALRPYVQRIVAGESGLLTAEDPFMFTATSGTTGEPKLIPLTPSWRKTLAKPMTLWLYEADQAHPTLLTGCTAGIVSPAIEARTPRGTPIGSVSGLTYRRVPWIIRRNYAIPYRVAEIADYDTRYFVAMRLALARDVTFFTSPNPSTLIRLAEVAAAKTEEILRAIHDGDEHASSDPLRARELEAVARAEGALRPRDAWPRLALLGCWLGGSAGVQARRLARHYGDVPLRDLGYRASEGTFTIPIADETPAGVLSLPSHFYEFVPEDAIDQAPPPALLAHELEGGRRYYILLTTHSGLYRYDINDIVEVSGFHEHAPLLAFVRKGRDMVSITGEKLHSRQILEAAEQASAVTGVEWVQIQLIPDVDASRYDLLVELRDLAVALSAFATAFDERLAGVNVEYQQKRRSNRLHAPRVVVMKPGWFDRQWRADVLGGRKRDAQYKWPVIRFEWDDALRRELLDRADEAAV